MRILDMSRLARHQQSDEDFGESLHFSLSENLALLRQLAVTDSDRQVVELLSTNTRLQLRATDEWLLQRGYPHLRPEVAQRAAGGIKALTTRRTPKAHIPSIAS